MKFIKKNFKIIIAFVMGIVLASGACIYAAYKYNSTEVVYKKQDGNEVSVKSALDELYSNTKSSNIVLAAKGLRQFDAKERTATIIPNTEYDDNLFQISNNSLIVKKAGKYLITYTAGSADKIDTVYTSLCGLFINDTEIHTISGVCSLYDINNYIATLNVGDIIELKSWGSAPDSANSTYNLQKLATYEIYYAE